MSRRRRNFSRKIPLTNSLVLTSVLIGTPGMVWAVLAYVGFVGLDDRTPISLLPAAGILFTVTVCFVAGMAVRGSLWALAAKLFGGLTPPELEGVLASGPPFRPIDLYNRACLDLLFDRPAARE